MRFTNLRLKYKELISPQQIRWISILVIFAFLFDVLIYPLPTFAQNTTTDSNIDVDAGLSAADLNISMPAPDSGYSWNNVDPSATMRLKQNNDAPAGPERMSPAEYAAAVNGPTPDQKTNESADNAAQLPEIRFWQNSGMHVLTAYNSEIGQTDSDPCSTANGFDLCKHNTEDSLAANFLPFGTQVKIPELYGDRIFIVRDRMNSRFPDRLDVWFKDHGRAIHFGTQYATIFVLK